LPLGLLGPSMFSYFSLVVRHRVTPCMSESHLPVGNYFRVTWFNVFEKEVNNLEFFPIDYATWAGRAHLSAYFHFHMGVPSEFACSVKTMTFPTECHSRRTSRHLKPAHLSDQVSKVSWWLRNKTAWQLEQISDYNTGTQDPAQVLPAHLSIQMEREHSATLCSLEQLGTLKS
jgi:hypothetical protein